MQSELIALDIESWWMSLSISALLLAFVLGYALQDGPYAFITPYIDPGILAILALALALMPGPAKTVIKAVSQILKITPSELDQVRGEIAAGIGREGPNRWISIGFTRDRRWL